jgi:hypothetical protein
VWKTLLYSFLADFFVGECLHCRFKRIDGFDSRLQLFDVPSIRRTEEGSDILFDPSSQCALELVQKVPDVVPNVFYVHGKSITQEGEKARYQNRNLLIAKKRTEPQSLDCECASKNTWPHWDLPNDVCPPFRVGCADIAI